MPQLVHCPELDQLRYAQLTHDHFPFVLHLVEPFGVQLFGAMLFPCKEESMDEGGVLVSRCLVPAGEW